LRLDETGKLFRSEVRQGEQLPDLPSCAAGNHQTARCRNPLQSRRKIGRLAHDRLLLRRALADQIADDHQPSGDADPNFKLGISDV